MRGSMTSTRRAVLTDGWTCAATAPDAADGPAALEGLSPRWFAAVVPGTAAAALRAAGAWTLGDVHDFDAEDWWWRCRFVADRAAEGDLQRLLRFEGLATIAEVWLNGELLARSENMFRALVVDVSARLRDDVENELVVCCRALRPRLAPPRRPRPRWKTRLVADQAMRWFRTALFGRMPGWCPDVAPVGPWRPVTLESRGAVAVRGVRVRAWIEGEDGLADVAITLAPGHGIEDATLCVGDAEATLAVELLPDGGVRLAGQVRLPRVAPWWPHTHGAAARYVASARLRAGAIDHVLSLSALAFRTFTLDRGADGEGFGLVVNGVPIFARGAVWTTQDIVRLDAPREHLRVALEAARRAGMNMLRVGGTMVPESDAFYELCDELGILVWQEFPFANFDYPTSDPAWHAGALAEADELLERLEARACVAVLCGSSEIEQQAAMLGLPREAWRSEFFDVELRRAAADRCPQAAYVSSSPTGGAMPFHVDRGVGHYYGVGAYLRPLTDARHAGVRFASECLAFANVPAPATVALVGPDPLELVAWKGRVPRDRGAEWDFEDVREHYVASLFRVDPAALRASDPERWLALGRVVTGEVMAATFAEWRRAGSTCRGGLVWTLQDLWPGAGWGVIDSTGRPKAAYHYLARAFAPIALLFTDEGVNGLRAHAVNDGPAALDARLTVELLRGGEASIADGAAAFTVPAHGVVALDVDALLEGFRDPAYAYRFGPCEHDVVVARLLTPDGARLGEAFHFPQGLPAGREALRGLTAVARPAPEQGDGVFTLTISAQWFAYACVIEASGFSPDDNFFHVAPRAPRTILLRPDGAAGRAPSGHVAPTNAIDVAPIVLDC